MDVNYEVKEHQPEMWIWGIDDGGKRVLIIDRNFLCYFYLVVEDGENPQVVVERIKSSEAEFPFIVRLEPMELRFFGKPTKVIRVVCQDPDLIPKYAKGVGKIKGVKDCLEGDIRYSMRYLIDNNVSPCGWHEIEVEEIKNELGVHVDKVYLAKSFPKGIEKTEVPRLRILGFSMICHSPKGAPKPERNPVVVISVATNAGDEIQFLTENSNDKPVIESFIKYVKNFDPDIIVGYGTNQQDWPYLVTRSKKLGIHLFMDRANTEPHTSVYGHVSITGRANIDFFDFAEDLPGVKVKTLENVADFLDVMKIEKRTLIEDIDFPTYWDDPEKRPALLRFSKENTQCIMGITDAMLDFAMQLSNMVGLPLDHVGTAAVGFRVEWFLIREAYKIGELVPKRIERPYIPYVGAVVLEPKPGIHENIAVLDFKSVDYDEPIVLMDDNNNLYLTKIGEFIDKHAGSLMKISDECEVAELNCWKVLSFDENLNVCLNPIRQFSRHRYNGKLLKITTKTGREVKVTPNHSLFTLSNRLKPIPLKASDVNKGSFIVIPRSVKLPMVYQEHVSLLKLMRGLNKDQLSDIYFYRKFPKGYWNWIKAKVLILDAISSGANSTRKAAIIIGHRHCNIYRHIYDLHKHKLIIWDKGRGNLQITKLGKEFLQREKLLLRLREYVPWRRCYRFRLSDALDVLENVDSQYLKNWKIGFKRTREQHLIDVILPTKTLATLLGYYVAEGCTSKSARKERAGQYQYKVHFTAADIVKEMKEVAEALGFHSSAMKGTGFNKGEVEEGFSLSSQLHYFLFDVLLNAGRCAREKRVPPIVFLFDEVARRSFVEAYLKGDGHLRSDGVYIFGSMSDKLIQGMSLLLMSMRKLGVTLWKDAKSNMNFAWINDYYNKAEKHTHLTRQIPVNFIPKTYPRSQLPRKIMEKAQIRTISRTKLLRWAEKNYPELITFFKSDLTLDYVVKIEEANPTTEFVYDIGVNPTQNFVCGHCWICAHNSLYPNIMISQNVSPDTYVSPTEPEPPCGVNTAPEVKHRFRTEPSGFYKEVLSHLIMVRDEIRPKLKMLEPQSVEYRVLDARQKAVKVITNACLDYDTPIIIRRNGNISVVRIGEFIDTMVKTNDPVICEDFSEFVKPTENLETLSFDPITWEVMWRRVFQCVRHRLNHEMLEIELKSGASIRVTPEHKMYVLDEEGELTIKKAADIHCGEWLPLLSQMPSSKRYTQPQLNLLRYLVRIEPKRTENIMVIIQHPYSKKTRINYEAWCRILAALKGKPSGCIKEIAHHANYGNPKSVSKHLINLKKMGFVERAPYIGRERKKVFRITPSGENLYDALSAFSEKILRDPNGRRHYVWFNDIREVVEKLPLSIIHSWLVKLYKSRDELPVIITAVGKVARLVGYYVSDGTSDEFKNKTGGTSRRIIWCNSNPRIREDIIHCFNEAFGPHLNVSPRQITANSGLIYIIFIDLLKTGKRVYRKAVPDFIINGPNKLKWEFLRAYDSGDGNKTLPYTRWTTVNFHLQNQLILLMKQLGVQGGSIRRDCGAHRVLVHDSLPSRREYRVGHRMHQSFIIPRSVALPLLRETKSNCDYLRWSDSNISKAQIKRILNDAKNGKAVATDQLSNLIANKLYFEQIAKIRKVEQRSPYIYDITIEAPHTLFAGLGFIGVSNCYGYAGWLGARWYVKPVAEATTAWGRNAILNTIELAKEIGLEVVYGDTDSIFIEHEPDKIEKISEEISKTLGLEIKPDKVYRRVLFTEAKKRYCGLLPDGRLDIVGLEVIRGDWAAVAKNVQETVLNIILKELSPEKAAGFVRQYVSDLREKKVPYRDLIIWKTLTKPLEEYAVRAPHVEAARMLLRGGWDLSMGDKIGYVIVAGPGRLYEKARPHVLASYDEVDIEYYVSNQVVPAVSRILSMFGVAEDELLAPTTPTLHKFGGLALNIRKR
ncbi:MAG: DNA polymerase [Candidatus Bathyarchaeota archaeon BA1]|nr:MAG: DNA polymerase [Candidatus Bathyarchaeota archaeon BA1]